VHYDYTWKAWDLTREFVCSNLALSSIACPPQAVGDGNDFIIVVPPGLERD